MNYEADIKIDRDDLDSELERQPELYGKVALDHALVISRRDELEADWKDVRSTAEINIREQAAENGEKITEARVRAEVDSSKDVKEARKRFMQAKASVDRLAALKDAYSQRAFILKDLCNLWIAGYYTTSSVKGGDGPREVRSQDHDERRELLAQARRKRNRL